MWIHVRVDCQELSDKMEIFEDLKDPSGRFPEKMLLGRGIPSVVTRIWQEVEMEKLLQKLRAEIAVICVLHERLRNDRHRTESVSLFVRALEMARNVRLPPGEAPCLGR